MWGGTLYIYHEDWQGVVRDGVLGQRGWGRGGTYRMDCGGRKGMGKVRSADSTGHTC
jgi:hypothetical protein